MSTFYTADAAFLFGKVVNFREIFEKGIAKIKKKYYHIRERHHAAIKADKTVFCHFNIEGKGQAPGVVRFREREG